MTSKPLKQTRGVLLRSSIIFWLIGIVLIGVVARSNARYTPRVVTIPLVFSQPGTFEADFTTDVDTEHELHIEVVWNPPPDDIRRAMGIVDGPSDIDLTWIVSHEESVVARGDARWYTFVGYNIHWPNRVIDKLFWMGPHERVNRNTLSRGIGAFPAQTASRYRLTATVNTPFHMMDQVEPVLVVQIGRRFWMRHTSRMLPLGYAGIICVMLGGVMFMIWLVRLRLSV